MSKVLRTIVILILICTSILLFSCGEISPEDLKNYYKDYVSYFETEYFECIVWKNGVAICELTEEGKKLSEIIIPNKLNGIDVDYLGDPRFYPFGTYGHPLGIYISKVFFSSELKNVYMQGGASLIATNRVAVHSFAFNFRGEWESNVFYVPLYIRIDEEVVGFSIEKKNRAYSNIIYNLNIGKLGDSIEDWICKEHDQYWHDFLEEGERIITIPPDPIREGYSFAGWYTERECINSWNFKEIPSLIPLNKERLVTNLAVSVEQDEIRERLENFTIPPVFALYAKWIEE